MCSLVLVNPALSKQPVKNSMLSGYSCLSGPLFTDLLTVRGTKVGFSPMNFSIGNLYIKTRKKFLQLKGKTSRVFKPSF